MSTVTCVYDELHWIRKISTAVCVIKELIQVILINTKRKEAKLPDITVILIMGMFYSHNAALER